MNDHEHIPLDAALEALARPEPAADHVERVLARTGPREASVGRAGSPSRRAVALGEGGSRPSPSLRPRWALAVAATLLAVLGGAWLGERAIQTRLDVVMRMEAARSASAAATADASENGPYALPLTARSENGPYPGDGTPIELPVLPPQAYWGMDPFEEFARLRPTRPDAAFLPRVARTRAAAADDELWWSAGPSGSEPGTARSENGPYPLPRIEMAAIVPEPIVVAPLAPLADIVLAEIELSPIVIAPLIEEEKP